MIYAIHRIRKEHRVLAAKSDHAAVDNDITWRIVEADAGGWIAHDGGERPLPRGVRCDVRFDKGRADNVKATMPKWSMVKAYRPILDAGSKPEPCRFHGDDAEACETYSGQVPCEPEPPAWDGESWPPREGERVESRERGSDEFLPGAVKAVGRSFSGTADRIAVKTDCGKLLTYGGETEMVRPIRSDEDKRIGALAKLLLDSVNCDGEDFCHNERLMAVRLNAAIRDGKVPGVKLEDES